nr:MAG TPA: hypothetical protein [Caudoviricetes sp.]
MIDEWSQFTFYPKDGIFTHIHACSLKLMLNHLVI